MSDQDTNPALLPAGFADLLPPQAQREADAVNILMQEFLALGYQRVKPPLAEFEDSLLATGPGAALSGQTFRLMDPFSHRMMGVRPDMTVQIARIAASRLSGVARPLRLAYAGDVMRTRPGQQRSERQFCQAGCEIIGVDDDNADIEICVLALTGLAALQLRPVTLDLTMPRLVGLLLDQQGISQDAQSAIREALARRDEEDISKLAGPAADAFIALLCAAGDAANSFRVMRGLGLAGAALRDLEKLEAVYAGVVRAIGEMGLEGVTVTIDPAEHTGFDYESGIGFTLFSPLARGELGRGGRYEISFGNAGMAEAATGFTLYMDTVCRALPPVFAGNILFVSYQESWDTVRALQGQGWTVLRGASPGAGCTHQYKDGKISEITI